MSEILTLDVGGVIFKINKELLLKKSEYFKSLFEDNSNLVSEKVIYVDRSPHIFKHVLSFIRDSTYDYPIKYISELKYFLVDFDPNLMKKDENEILLEIRDNINSMNKTMKSVKNSINSLDNTMEKVKNLSDPRYCRICESICDNPNGDRHCNKCDRHYDNCNCSCWDETVFIYELDKGWVLTEQLEKGDYVLTGENRYSKVLEIQKSYATGPVKVKYFNGIRLTYGHPVLLNEEWKRPWELKEVPILMESNFYLYNLVLERDHSVILRNDSNSANSSNVLTVATLGLFPDYWKKDLKN